jgi:hypothetical protein
MGPGEVLSLRRKDIDLEKKTVTVNPEGAKNPNRVRLIPLEGSAFDVCKYALDQAEKKGSVSPEHYVFPFCNKVNNYDPTRHQTTLKTSWQQMLKYAGITSLRMYDLRHTAITRLCEDPENSEETIESIAGHITHQMKKRYCHIRVEARRAALARLAPARVATMETVNKERENNPKNGKSMNNQHVLDLVAAGLSADVIVAKIKRALAKFDTEPETLKALKAAGVPNAVILAMVQA